MLVRTGFFRKEEVEIWAGSQCPKGNVEVICLVFLSAELLLIDCLDHAEAHGAANTQLA